MFNARLALAAATVVGVAFVPAAGVHASHADSDAVGGLAADAAQVVAEEQELIALNAPSNPMSAADRAEARSRLRAVDAEGSELLAQLDSFGVELTGAARTTLSRLPQASFEGGRPPMPPPPVVYDAAVADLMRIAATPAAVTASAARGEFSNSLWIVAGAALIALTLAAASNAMRRKDETLEALAWSDGLTGVANRRRLDHDLAAHHDEHSGPTAVIMIDVDHFKLVNDRYGHQVGDDVLRSVGTAIAGQVRHGDVVYRYGGEEFCVLLPGAGAFDAQTVADRIVLSAREIVLPGGEHVTVSVGVAEGAPAEVVSTLESADRALYAAKAGGRDQAKSLQPT